MVALLLMPAMVSCSRSLVGSAISDADVVARSKSMGDDYAINVVSPRKQIVVGGKYDTVTPMRFTEVMQDSVSEYSMIYIDDNPAWLEAEGSNTLRYIYGNFDTSFYSVKFENVALQHGCITFDLVIAGRAVAEVNAYALDGEGMPENVGGLLTEDGPGKKLLKKIVSLIPPIDISLGSNNTITVNNGNGNVNGNGNSTGGGNSPCHVSDAVAQACINAGIETAKICKQINSRPYVHHGECHNGCTYYCY